jgi:hypothetical protein
MMMRRVALGFIVTTLVSGSSFAANKIPIREGEYTREACKGGADILESIGVYVAREGPQKGLQVLSPQAEEQDGYCALKRVETAGNVYSGSAACESGTRMALPTGTYKFAYTVLDQSTFISKGVTYRWCAAGR